MVPKKRQNISTMIPNLNCSNSSMEINNNSVVANPYSSDNTLQLRMCSDENHIAERQTKKSCGICTIIGHQRKACPKITQWNKEPVYDIIERKNIARYIAVPNYYNTIVMKDSDILHASLTLPTSNVRIIIIHDICIKYSQCNNVKTNLVKCTLLNNVGIERLPYIKFWFHSDCISDWIIKGGKFTTKYLISFLSINLNYAVTLSQDNSICQQNTVYTEKVNKNQELETKQMKDIQQAKYLEICEIQTSYKRSYTKHKEDYFFKAGDKLTPDVYNHHMVAFKQQEKEIDSLQLQERNKFQIECDRDMMKLKEKYENLHNISL